MRARLLSLLRTRPSISAESVEVHFAHLTNIRVIANEIGLA
jgi:hypothetical protein